MPLEIVGAGFGRTGTSSLKRALERLGFAPCHHMIELIEGSEQRDMWRAIADGAPPDWDAVFAGYRAQVDWPGAFFWRELAAHFPDAKVILSVRDPDRWFDSFSKTIGAMMAGPPGEDGPSTGRRLIVERTFGDRHLDRDHAIAVFEAHNAEVKATIPPERLLVWEARDGWGPLAEFLGREAPDEPFPHANTRDDFFARFSSGT